MRHKVTLILGVVIAVALGLHMTAFQVRFNETAVVTTFGKASTSDVLNVDGEGGALHWKWPWPIQDVRRYDARIQILEDRLEEQQTLDKQDVIVKAYVAWRIVEPLEFFRALRTVPEAKKQLQARLRDARGEIGKFSFQDLTNSDPAKLKIDEVEAAILQRLQGAIEKQGYGIRIELVGLKRILLPQRVTKKVFERMRGTRSRLAQRARSEGDADASKIISRARSGRDRILSFAKRRADAIRAQGEEEAAKYYETFQQNESLAIFLRKVEALKKILGHRSTFLLDPNFQPLDLFETEDGKKLPNSNVKDPSNDSGNKEVSPKGPRVTDVEGK